MGDMALKFFVPNWYPDFHCIAERCRHSCCIGWEIDIDPKTLAKYQNASGGWKKRFEENIVFEGETACFRLSEDERCPFLNERGLCDIILAHGEEALSQICTDHPRYRNFFCDRTEIGLGLCCEEAARIILSQKERAYLVELSDDGVHEAHDEEETAFFAWRSQLLAIAQDRRLSVTERLRKLCFVSGFSYDVCCPAARRDLLLSLERMDEAWMHKLIAMQEETERWEIPFEQLLFCLFFRHLSGALEDGLYAERVALCVLLLRLIRAVPMISFEELIETCRMASSEIEYSDQNIDRILDELMKLLQPQES